MTKYKPSLNNKIRGYIEWQLEHYHEDKRALEQYKKDLIPSATAKPSLTGGVSNGRTSDPTGDTALKIATNPYILSTERSIKAIEKVLERCDHTDTKLIELVYWRRSHTVEGAGMVAGLSRQGAYNRINRILRRLALELGIINL